MRKAWNIALCSVTAITFSGCTCDQTRQAEEKSPAGDKLAIIIALDCDGVFGGTSTQVSIRNSNTPLSTRDGVVLIIDAKVPITIWWKDNQTLVVYGPKELFRRSFADDRIKAQHSEVDGVQIVYQEI